MKDIINTIMEYKEEAKRNIVICAPKMEKEPFEKRSIQFTKRKLYTAEKGNSS